jgi:plastocyanin
VPVRLIFTNRSGSTHEFDAPSFFRSARILAGRAPNGEVEVKKGRTAVIDLVPARGTYKVHCGRPFHTMLGMTTRVIVS